MPIDVWAERKRQLARVAKRFGSPNRRPPDYGQLAKGVQVKLRGYDQIELLGMLAALATDPRVVDQLTRINVLAVAAANLEPPAVRGAKLGKKILLRLLNDEPLGKLHLLDDPMESAVTVSLPGPFGPLTAFCGKRPESPFIYQHAAQVLQSPTARISAEARRQFEEILAGAALLHKAMENPSLPGPNVIYLQYPVPKKIAIPTNVVLGESAQTFIHTDEYWAELCKWASRDEKCIAPLIGQLGTVPLPEQGVDASEGGLALTPVVRSSDGRRVIASPENLLPAAVHVGLARVIALGEKMAWVEDLADELWKTATTALFALGHLPIPDLVPPPSETSLIFRDAFVGVDFDKALYVLLIPDQMSDYDPVSPHRFGRAADDEQIRNRLIEVEKFVNDKFGMEDQLQFLVLMQAAARPVSLLVDTSRIRRLKTGIPMPVSLLATIAKQQETHPQTLWHYIQARCDRGVRELLPPQMDEPEIFGHYWFHDHHFPVHDLKKGMLLPVNPYDAGRLHASIAMHQNPHWMFGPGKKDIRLVSTAHGTPRIPIYGEHVPRGRKDSYAYTGGPKPIWVVHTEALDPQEAPDFADTITYWLWQMGDYLRNLNWHSCEDFVIHVQREKMDPTPSEELETEQIGLQELLAEVVIEPARTPSPALHLTISRKAYQLFEGPDNQGERSFIKAILRGLTTALGTSLSSDVIDQQIQAVMDQVAPIGSKRRLMMSWTGNNPGMDHRFRVPICLVEPEDFHAARNVVLAYMKNEGLTARTLSNAESSKLLTGLVARLADEVTSTLDTLRGDGLLPFFIELYEALCYYRSALETLTPGSLIAFPEESDVLETLLKNEQRIIRTLGPMRFLIEYVAARPPTGTKRYAMQLHGKLLALGSLIIELGTYEDAVRHDKSVKATVMLDGTIAMQGGDYGNLQAKQSISRLRKIANNPNEFLKELNPRRAPVDHTKLSLPFDDIALEHKGARMSDTTLLLWSAMNIGMEATGGAISMSEPSFLTTVQEMVNIPRERLAHALEEVCLDARPTFFNPNPPLSNHDVYPWRFNRELSYMRRPLVREQMPTGERRLHWGHRHVLMANQIRTERVQEGNIPKRTPEWEVAVSKHRNTLGDAFAERVHASLKTKFVAFLKAKLPGDAKRLGDIDVLVVEPANRLVLLIECKAYTMRRTAHDYANERRLLFGEGDSITAKSALGKHLRRASWVKNNTRSILEARGITGTGPWDVKAIVVFESDVLSSYSSGPPLPMIDYEQLQTFVDTGSFVGVGSVDWGKADAIH